MASKWVMAVQSSSNIERINTSTVCCGHNNSLGAVRSGEMRS